MNENLKPDEAAEKHREPEMVVNNYGAEKTMRWSSKKKTAPFCSPKMKL